MWTENRLEHIMKRRTFREFIIAILGITLLGLSCYVSVTENTMYSWITALLLLKIGIDCLEAIHETVEQFYE